MNEATNIDASSQARELLVSKLWFRLESEPVRGTESGTRLSFLFGENQEGPSLITLLNDYYGRDYSAMEEWQRFRDPHLPDDVEAFYTYNTTLIMLTLATLGEL